MSVDEIIERERKRAFGFTDDRRCLLTYGDFRRLLMEIESAAKREECELLAQIVEFRQKIDDGEFFTPKAARDAIAGERPLDEMLKAPLPTGNAAAMREALELCVKQMCATCREAAHKFNPEATPCVYGCETLKMAKAALAAPLRNCDKYSHGEALTIWAAEKENAENGCFDEWLYAPVAERKGESDGR